MGKILIYTLTIGLLTFTFDGKALAMGNVASIMPDYTVEQSLKHEVRRKVKRYKKKDETPKKIHRYDYRNFKYKKFRRKR